MKKVNFIFYIRKDIFTAFRPHGNPITIYINIKDPKNPILKEIGKEEKSK